MEERIFDFINKNSSLMFNNKAIKEAIYEYVEYGMCDYLEFVTETGFDIRDIEKKIREE